MNSRRRTKRKIHDDAIGLDDGMIGDRLLPDNNTENNPSLAWRAQKVLVVKGFIIEYEEAPLV